jgi:surfactin synthase thioesterase subunit
MLPFMLSNWLISAGTRTAAKVNFFCFPYAGGGASVFRSWPKFLDQSIQLFGVQAPGRESRFSEKPLITISDYAGQAAQVIMKQTGSTPLVLFGHSLGAAVAYETARCIERTGKKVSCLIVSGRQAPHLKSKMMPISQQSDLEFIASLKRLGGTAKEVLANPELLEILVPMIKSDFAMSETYVGSTLSGLTCPVWAIGSKDDIWLDSNSLNLWNYVTTGQFETKWFEGDHFYLNSSSQADLLLFISEELRRIGFGHCV